MMDLSILFEYKSSYTLTYVTHVTMVGTLNEKLMFLIFSIKCIGAA